MRSQGYAINREEFGAGLLGLAAPVYDGSGEVVAAIGVFVPSTNIKPEELESQLAEPVLAAARAASTNLGFIAAK